MWIDLRSRLHRECSAIFYFPKSITWLPEKVTTRTWFMFRLFYFGMSTVLRNKNDGLKAILRECITESLLKSTFLMIAWQPVRFQFTDVIKNTLKETGRLKCLSVCCETSCHYWLTTNCTHKISLSFTSCKKLTACWVFERSQKGS